MDDGYKQEDFEEIKKLIKKMRGNFELESGSSRDKQIFNLVATIDTFQKTLIEVWKISQLHQISDPDVSKDFIQIASQLSKTKKDIKTNFFDKKLKN